MDSDESLGEDEKTLHETAADRNARSCVPSNAELARRINIKVLVSQVLLAAGCIQTGDPAELGFPAGQELPSYQPDPGQRAGNAATRGDGYDHLFGGVDGNSPAGPPAAVGDDGVGSAASSR